MAKQLQLRRGTTAQNFGLTGAEGEPTYDTELKRLVLHDGIVAGGKAINLPRGYIDGLRLERDSVNFQKLDIRTGQATDSQNETMLDHTKNLKTIRLTTSGAGGLFSGTVAANTWYHVFLIQQDSNGTISGGFDTSLTAANRPAGWTRYRRIGSIKTNASSDITNFLQHGDLFLWTTAPTLDINDTALGTTRKTYTLANVPIGVEVLTFLNIYTASALVYVSHPEASDQSPSITAAPLLTAGNVAGVSRSTVASHFLVKTDASAQITARADASPSTLRAAVIGWIDQRGKDSL